MLVDAHPDGTLEWLGAAVGVAGLILVFLASVYVLRSHDLQFSVDVREAYNEAVDRAVDNPETVQREIALTLSDVYADNDPTVFAMRAWFALALVGLGAEIVGFSVGAALV